MKHLSLEIQSYRAYRDRAKLDLKPLTLVYGHNQAGKSTVLRLLGVLADSLFSGKGALDISSPALCGATFKELGWLGLDMSLTPQITLTSSSDASKISFQIKFARDDDGEPIVNTLKITKGSSLKLDLSFDELISRRGGIPIAKYSGECRGSDWSGKLTFRNLLPEGLPEDIQNILNEEVFQDPLSRFERLQWLQANRLVDGETQIIRELRCCQPDGAGLAELLKGEPEVLSKISSWLSHQGLANQISIHRNDMRQGDEFAINHSGREALRLALAGEGLRSLLPILLCAAWAESDSEYAPTMLAIEEPESHLHPTLQVELFNRLLETVKSGVPVVLETHSVYILRAMQVAVLEKRLSAEDVGLHWVSQSPENGSARIEAITVEEDAVLRNWLPYTFEKEQELAQQIIDLRWKEGRIT